MEVISSQNVWNIISTTLNCVDSRLVEHGERVAFIAAKMLQAQGDVSQRSFMDVLMLCLLHDIGAYKTEEIDHMVEFETNYSWEHSVYGYLFLSKFSPVGPLAQAILYHHVPHNRLRDFPISDSVRNLAQLIHLADRIDLIEDREVLFDYLAKQNGILFSEWAVDLFLRAEARYSVLSTLRSGDFQSQLEEFTAKFHFTEREKQSYLSLISYSIDFRSEFMVLHTITTVSISCAIAQLMKLSDETIKTLFYGALLHDIGKVATPVEILEKPGRLTFEEMEIMKNHVVASDEILRDFVEPHVRFIAARHHEKLDGTGYPLCLIAEDLTLEERICAVADITSALLRKRSYKEAFDPEKTQRILNGLMESGKICPEVTSTLLEHFDELTQMTAYYNRMMTEAYRDVKAQYQIMTMQILENGMPTPIRMLEPVSFSFFI